MINEHAFIHITPDKGAIRKILLLFCHKNISCGYSLEVPQWGTSNDWGTSNEYPQGMFSWRNVKNINVWLRKKKKPNLELCNHIVSLQFLTQYLLYVCSICFHEGLTWDHLSVCKPILVRHADKHWRSVLFFFFHKKTYHFQHNSHNVCLGFSSYLYNVHMVGTESYMIRGRLHMIGTGSYMIR